MLPDPYLVGKGGGDDVKVALTFRISLLVWKIACPMSSVILTDIIHNSKF